MGIMQDKCVTTLIYYPKLCFLENGDEKMTHTNVPSLYVIMPREWFICFIREGKTLFCKVLSTQLPLKSVGNGGYLRTAQD